MEDLRRDIMKLTFNMPVNIFFGQDCIAENSAALKKLGKKALIVTDPISAEVTGAGADIKAALDKEGIEYIMFDQVESNPTIGCVRKAVALSKANGVDFIFSVGGGSSLDTGKAVALLSRQDATDDELFTKAFTSDVLPIAAVPTTSGTGSEVTPYAMIIDEKKGTKNNLNLPYFFSKLAFLDPKYTLTLPPRITVNTSIDALTHALESLFVKTTNPLVASVAYEAIRNISSCFNALMSGDLTLDEREKLMLGSVMAGMVVSQTRTSALHGMSYPMTSVGHIPHGRAMALIIANYMRFWQKHEPELVDRLMDAMQLHSLDSFVNIIRTLVGEVKPEEKLSEDTIKAYTDEVMGKHNIINTRVPITRADVESIYHY